jgi:hypothetical protein
VLTRIGRYVRRKWWFLLLVSFLLALNVWVWRLRILPLAFLCGFAYVIIKGWPMVLRESGL